MPVYLDHAATTPMLPEAVEALIGALAEVGNPASIHSVGQRAKQLLEEARERVAASLGADPIEVVFTGSGTEAVNLAVKGLAWRAADASAGHRRRIIMPAGEHHATLDTVEWLAGHDGATVEVLPLDREGRLVLPALEATLASSGDVALVTMLAANNEVGTVQPVAEAAALAAAAGVPMHVDAIAAYGQVPIDVRALQRESRSAHGAGLVALSVSAHKIGGPMGVGALVLDRSAVIEPLLHGGGQQRRIRSGTQDVPSAVAFGVAAELTAARLAADAARMSRLRDRLIAGVRAAVPDAVLSGPEPGSLRLPGNANFTFPGCEGDSLLFLLDAAGVAVSTGAACTAGVPEPSHVLMAMGRSEPEARGSLRMTLGHASTDADVDAVLAALPAAWEGASRAGLAARATGFDR